MNTTPYATLILWVSLGVMYVAHSLILKHFTFTLPGSAQFFASLGLPAALAYATFWAELVGGVALVLGYPLLLIVVSVAVALLGDGKYSLADFLRNRNIRLGATA
ncbi:MAG: DoxX family protein [Betaproteobacteria bacterium]